MDKLSPRCGGNHEITVTANPRILKSIGGLLLAVSALLAFTWYFWLAPARKSHSMIWISEHTARAQWIQFQKQLNRTGLDHDASIAIGYYTIYLKYLV